MPGIEPIKVYIHSDVVPGKRGGGELVLHRHFVDRPEFEASWTSVQDSALFQNVLWKRVKSTRLSSFAERVERFLAPKSYAKALAVIDKFGPHVIVTVAHGRRYLEAASLGKERQIPVATIFHDWWPDLAPASYSKKHQVESDFLNSYRKSDLNCVVSEPLLARLGEHSNSIVLPPIPGLESLPSKKKQTDLFRVCYSGNLFHYGAMLQPLMEFLHRAESCELVVRGHGPPWEQGFVDRMSKSGNYLPAMSLDQLPEWQSGFDAHLCVMQFDQSARRRMETSFPSKMVDAYKFRVPVIVWGPDYCSAIQWATANDGAVAITSPDPLVAASEIEAFAKDHQSQAHYSERSERIYKSKFNATVIQQQLVNALTGLAHGRLS